MTLFYGGASPQFLKRGDFTKNQQGQFIILSVPEAVTDAAQQVKLLPMGVVPSRKGEFLVDALAFKEMYAYYKGRAIDIVVDYEHQTLADVQAPAGGWIKELHLKADGIYADVEWTDKAKAYIANKEYRYLSPVVFRRKSDGRAVVLQSVALTNVPAVDGMEPIINSMKLEGGTDMDFMKQLAKALGLAEDATEAQVMEAVVALNKGTQQTDVVANKAVLDALALPETAKVDDVTGAIIALKNPAGYVSVAAFKALEDKINAKDSENLVQMALSAGKITPAQKNWADELALKDPAGFKKFIETAPQVVPLEEVAGGGTAKKAPAGMDESVNKLLGVSKEDIEKYGKETE